MASAVDYDAYLRSPEWQARRAAAVKRASGRCQLCNAGGKLHVHHRTYERLGHEAPGDLTVLCVACHERFHNAKEPSNRPSRRKQRSRARNAYCRECGAEPGRSCEQPDGTPCDPHAPRIAAARTLVAAQKSRHHRSSSTKRTYTSSRDAGIRAREAQARAPGPVTVRFDPSVIRKPTQ